MKIELKLTSAQIAFLATVINSFVDDHKQKFISMSRQEKAAYTIAVDIADKLHNKVRILNRKVSSSKPHKISFKYHEAHGINYFVRNLKDSGHDDYFDSVALTIFIQLDQKLT